MKKKSLQSKMAFLLPLSIIAMLLGVVILFVGALSHINPNIEFKNLLTKEPLMNLVQSIIPSIK